MIRRDIIKSLIFIFVFACYSTFVGADTHTFVHEGNLQKKANEDKKKDAKAKHDVEFPDLQQTLKWANDQVKAAKTLDDMKAAQLAINTKLINGIYLSKDK